MGGGQDNVLAHLPKVNTLDSSQSISQTVVEICPDGLLIVPEPIQFTLLNGCLGIHNILLEQPPPPEQI